jgi:hypothetical protein
MMAAPAAGSSAPALLLRPVADCDWPIDPESGRLLKEADFCRLIDAIRCARVRSVYGGTCLD